MTEQEKRNIKAALDDCFSGVDALPSMRADILRAAKGEQKVKRRMNMGLILALILVLMTTTVAVAAELGLFGQIGQQEDADVRLPALDAASSPVGKVFTTPEGVTVTIDQAYYDGTRVFVSYAVAGPTKSAALHEGKPDIVNYDWEKPGVIYANEYQDASEAGRQMAAWLDGSAERYATVRSVTVSDNMEMADGTDMNIIGGGGDDVYLEDGSYINWKECEVPADKAADEITVCLTLFTTERTYYQTADCLYSSYGGITGTSNFAFTVKKADVTEMTGTAKGSDWTAEARLNASVIDLKGEIIVEGPKGWTEIWTSWENPGNLDYINDWRLYVDGAKVDHYNMDGSVWTLEDGKVAFGICYKLDALSADMKLVPEYRYAGEKVEEAIPLTVAK